MSKENIVHSVCGMCGSRCLIDVHVEDGAVRWISGNPHGSSEGALCARGVAGVALEADAERPQTPLVRVGERGSGLWKAVSWEDAFDYVAARLQLCAEKYGPESVLWSDRDGPFTDLYRAFMRGLGSPNSCTHSVTCDLNVHHALRSVLGLGRGGVAFDYAHCRHLVLQGRNIFEAFNVGEVREVMAALQGGCRLSVLDVRPTVTSAKAQDVFCLRPGTDYAFNLAVIHTLIREKLYQREYVEEHAQGLKPLAAFVRGCTPQWAERETGVPAKALRELTHRLAEAAPQVIWHPGWMSARYRSSFHVARSAVVITALLGGIGVPGGILATKSPVDLGHKPLRRFSDLYPASPAPRVDGVGWAHPTFDPGKGLLHKAIDAMDSGDPYPIKAYVAWRHDPLQALPDPAALKVAFENLDLLVSVTFSWSDTAWHSDVVLPLSPYLSRESIIGTTHGLRPCFFVRKRAVAPRFDSKADWEIISGLARRLGLDKLAFDRVEDLWNYQLRDTGLRLEDFEATGFVPLGDGSFATADVLKFPTPSGKLDLSGTAWETAGGARVLEPYKTPSHPPKGAFRLIFGRTGVHTHGHTVNNPLLSAQMPENVAWLHPLPARKLGLRNGDRVEVLNSRGRSAGEVSVRVTEGIHPEALFLVHGFGHRLPCESRARGRGVADQELLCGGLRRRDVCGGGLALQESFATLRKVKRRT